MTGIVLGEFAPDRIELTRRLKRALRGDKRRGRSPEFGLMAGKRAVCFGSHNNHAGTAVPFSRCQPA